MFGPPEKVWSDKVESAVPGLALAQHEKGHVAYIPWDVGGLYYRHSSHAHAGLVADVIDRVVVLKERVVFDGSPTELADRGEVYGKTGTADVRGFRGEEAFGIRPAQVASPARAASSRATQLQTTAPIGVSTPAIGGFASQEEEAELVALLRDERDRGRTIIVASHAPALVSAA